MNSPEMNDDAPPVPSVLVVLCTCPPDRAEEIAAALVEQRLAACVNVTPPLSSIYRWQGKVERDEERLLVIKTSRHRWHELHEQLAAMHPYEVPEIIALPLAAGAESYLRWVEESL